MKVDVIIVGQGLAGSILAWQLMRREQKVLLIDAMHQHCASTVAAGLVNPITGKRMVKSWLVERCFPTALQFYRDLENTFQRRLFHEKSILRLFASPEERQQWTKRRLDNEYQPYLGEGVEPGVVDACVKNKHGGFYVHRAGYLDTRQLLSNIQVKFRQSQNIIETAFEFSDVKIHSDYVSWKNVTARKIIFCEGYQVMRNPWFSWLPMQPAQGDILTLKTNGNVPHNIINSSKWLLPVGSNHIKIGATFQWQPIDGKTTQNARRELISAFQQMWVGGNDYEVVEQVCGVRPATKDKKPFIGLHPQYPQLAVFNGFGAKGSLLIPFFADRFADVLTGAQSLNDEVDIARVYPG